MEAQKARTDQSQTVWAIDSQYSTLQFSSRWARFFKVTGSFTEFRAEVVYDETSLNNSSVAATINSASISTGIKRRDDHLRSADFLDAGQYPHIVFQSSRVEKGLDRDMLRVTGMLTIKGQSREVAWDVWLTDRSRSPAGDEILYCTATTSIDRHAFGISYGRWLIGRMVKVTIQVQAAKQR